MNVIFYVGLIKPVKFVIVIAIMLSRDIAVLCSHGSLSFACVFKHCCLKTSDFKPLKPNKQ